MFTVTIQCASLTDLQALVAQLGGEAPKTTAPKSTKTTSMPASPPEEKSAPAASTPEPQKGDDLGEKVTALIGSGPDTLTADALREIVDATITPEQFGQLGMKFAKKLGDQGAEAKRIWGQDKYKQADGSPVNRFGAVKPEDHAAMIGEWADVLAEKEMA